MTAQQALDQALIERRRRWKSRQRALTVHKIARQPSTARRFDLAHHAYLEAEAQIPELTERAAEELLSEL